ncbi:MAG: hypothetical protein GW875_01560 [Deltaproteobacteria bacterium]|nr:hypothetical protein [Deltaproteobacteria bacterium]
MTEKPIHQRGPLVCLLLFCVGLLTLLGVFQVWRLDVGNYKQQLANKLERTLGQPVRLGDISLGYHHGLTLHLNNLQIGSGEDFRLDVPRASALIDLVALFDRRLSIKQLVLDYPTLKLTSRTLEVTTKNPELERLQLKTLQIRKGNLTLINPDNPRRTLRLEDFNLIVHNPWQSLVTQLTAGTNLFYNHQRARVQATLNLQRQKLDQPWQQARVQGQLNFTNLQRQMLADWQFKQLPAQGNLQVNVQGIPAKGARVTALLTDPRDQHPLVSLTGDWQTTPTLDSLKKLALGVDRVPLAGELFLDHSTSDPKLRGYLRLQNTRLADILAASYQQTSKLKGFIDLAQLNFDGPLYPTAANPFAPIRDAKLTLKDLNAELSPNLTLDAGEGQVLLTNNQLQLHGQARLNEMLIKIQGQSSPLGLQRQFAVNLNLDAELALEKLAELLPGPFWQNKTLRGPATLSLEVSGPPEQLQVQGLADLSASQLDLGWLFEKPAQVPLLVQLNGRLTPTSLQQAQLGLQLGDQQLQVAGRLQHRAPGWQLDARMQAFDFIPLQSFSRILRNLHLRGGLAGGELHFSAGTDWQMQLTLKDAGVHLTQVLADPNQLTGVVRLSPRGLVFNQLTGQLGQSAVQISGDMRNWRSPLLALHVTSPQIRARDLIFRYSDLQMSDLDGHLLITAGGIVFEDVRVSLENRTHARVTGQLLNFRAPFTDLQIRATEADILDVIKLFGAPPADEPFTPPSAAAQNSKVNIVAQVERGQLGDFKFEAADGTISYQRELLTIAPLRFNIGDGEARGRVEIDGKRKHLLKISGQAINCNADRVYSSLLGKKGIFRGTLNGDFYLEGEEIGRRFWQTAHGGAHLQITDGAMRGLKTFARIFSLLNVSQLFTFQLPDMDKEGLPIQKLEVSGRIDQGVIAYENFRITSPAINISSVGKIDILAGTIDSTVGIKPLRTVDIILSRVPLFGWILTGEEEALITALFNINGTTDNPQVTAAPTTSVAKTALGIILRTLGLPFHLLDKTNKLLTTPPRPSEIPPDEAP